MENDWCDVRAAVPESYMLNPYCHVESPFQTSFRALATYTIPRIDVLLSTVFQDKINVGTDQIVSLAGQLHVHGRLTRRRPQRRSAVR